MIKARYDVMVAINVCLENFFEFDVVKGKRQVSRRIANVANCNLEVFAPFDYEWQ